MELTLPKTQGWSAMALTDDNWGHVGAVAKCAFVWAGSGATRAPAPVPIRQADAVDAVTNIILAEAELALFKTKVDWHFRGTGPNPPAAPDWYTAAELSVNDTVRVMFAAPNVPYIVDRSNLFGFEPRAKRHGSMDVPAGNPPFSFNLGVAGPKLFRATRRSEGYTLVNDLPSVPQIATVLVVANTGGGATSILDKTLRLPKLTLRAWLFEGGSDTQAYWCAKATAAMVPDTLILSTSGAEVLWRAAFPFSTVPMADLRRLSIEEEAA